MAGSGGVSEDAGFRHMLSERQEAGAVGLFSSVLGTRPYYRKSAVAGGNLPPLDMAALLADQQIATLHATARSCNRIVGTNFIRSLNSK